MSTLHLERGAPGLSTAALDYAARGWPVVPVDGKSPALLGKGWPDKASTDPNVIAGWWADWPAANVGIVTGARSGLVVIDVDRPGCQMADVLDELGLPPTLTARTGGGGLHLVYLRPEGDVPNRKRIAAGVDVRGRGGQFVAPPSIHQSGALYVWEDVREPVELPTWVAQLLTSKRPRPAPITAAPEPPRLVDAAALDRLPETARRALWAPSGPRNRRIWVACLSAVRAGLNGPEIEAAVMASPCAEKVRERGRDWLWNTKITPALAEVEATPGGPGREGFDRQVQEHEAAADAARDEWHGRRGYALHRVLQTFQAHAYRMGGGTFRASFGDLADTGPASKQALLRWWMVLALRGWIECVEPARQNAVTVTGVPVASRWRLTIPPERALTDHTEIAHRVSEHGPRARVQELSDVQFAAMRREALGASTDTLFVLVQADKPLTVRELAERTGRSDSQQRKHCAKLADAGLIARSEGRPAKFEPAPNWRERMADVARQTGAVDLVEAGRQRRARDREKHRERLHRTTRRDSYCHTCGHVLYGDPTLTVCPACTA